MEMVAGAFRPSSKSAEAGGRCELVLHPMPRAADCSVADLPLEWAFTPKR
jgi:hypothetical protein